MTAATISKNHKWIVMTLDSWKLRLDAKYLIFKPRQLQICKCLSVTKDNTLKNRYKLKLCLWKSSFLQGGTYGTTPPHNNPQPEISVFLGLVENWLHCNSWKRYHLLFSLIPLIYTCLSFFSYCCIAFHWLICAVFIRGAEAKESIF